MFSGHESAAENVAIVNAAFARAYFGTSDPIGKRFGDPEDAPWRTVIGVVGDTRNRGMASEPEPYVYTPFHTDSITSPSAATLILATRGPLSSITAPLRRIVRQIDPQQAMGDIGTLDDRLTREVSRERFLTWVLTAFAGLAATLAAIGVYGVGAYMVQQRRQEIGVRLALGAEPTQILRLVLGHGAKLLAVGVTAGVAGSIAATRVLEGYLFQISATDWRTIALAVAALATVAACACYGPARRASRTDPLSTLRYD
jgi:predicted lysophospholipase L1 biosynthesis ABC-type transport system permease subunit